MQSYRLTVNLTAKDGERWKAAAEVYGMPLASYVRRCVERDITETEDSWDTKITDFRVKKDIPAEEV